jgi:hypothetical protein
MLSDLHPATVILDQHQLTNIVSPDTVNIKLACYTGSVFFLDIF